MKIGIKNVDNHDELIIDFGKPVAWVGFHKKDVENFITTLQEKVKEMKDDITPRFNPN
jgi:hypothetical protein